MAVDKLNNVRVAIRNYLKEDVSITSVVGSRIYPSELAEIQSPKYPLITFKVTGGLPIRGIQVASVIQFNLEIKVFSKVSYDEAFRMYDSIRQRLIGAIIRRVDVNVVPKEVSSPSDFYDPIAKTYAVRGTFSIKALW